MKTGCRIESVGIQVPERIMTTNSIVERLKLQRPLKLELMTGIKERRICSDSEDSLTLALGAAEDCLRHSSIEPGEIEMIIYCAITRYVGGLNHVFEPAVSLMIKKGLGSDRAINFDITNACAGMLTGIHIGTDFIERGVVKSCLVVGGEYITSLCENAIHNIRTRFSPELASLTLGDAGGAVMLCRSDSEMERINVTKFVTLGKYSDLCIGYQSKHQQGGVMETQMKKIHEASIGHAPAIIEEALSMAGLGMDQIDHIVPHQTSRQAIKAGQEHFTEYFGTMAKNIVVNLAKMGNTASTSHVLAFYRLLKEKQVHPGEKIMFLSFASGLVIGVIIFSVFNLVDRYGSKH
jgi:3-oxoacyl-[acyl-carrier-protein] synthase-3